VGGKKKRRSKMGWNPPEPEKIREPGRYDVIDQILQLWRGKKRLS